MSVYSALLALDQVGTGTNLLYTSPTQITTVVRDIALTPVGAGADVIELLLEVSGLGEYIFYRVPSSPELVTVHWQGRQVMPPGSQIYSAANASNWQIAMSGYQLSG